MPPEVVSPESTLVVDYLERKHLSKIGITQDFNSLTDFERMYLIHCNSKFITMENKEREKNLKKRK